jgi:hypothetical protein
VTRANQISEWIAKRDMRSTLLGILVNPGLSATKISAGAVGHSFAWWRMAWSLVLTFSAAS